MASRRKAPAAASASAPAKGKPHSHGAVDPSVPICAILDTLRSVYKTHPMGQITQQDPYRVLIACILSLRTKDEVSIPASLRLFEQAATPQAMVALSVETIAKLIYPCGFYKTKAETVLQVSRDILTRFEGQTPDTIEALTTLKGVGRKTANLVVGLGHGLPAVCVDVHVHRICNRLGYLTSKTPDDTEMLLREHLPVEYWRIINTMLVLHGREICRPIGPHCDICPVATDCRKVDVVPRKGKYAGPSAGSRLLEDILAQSVASSPTG